MKIIASCAAIGPALAFVRDVIPARSPIPILSAIIAEAGDGSVALRATNLDADLHAVAPIDPTLSLDGNGSCVIDGRLAALISALPKTAEVTITVGDGAATLRSGRSRYKLPVLPPEDFPAPLAARFADEPSCNGHMLARVTLPLPPLTGTWPDAGIIMPTRAAEIVAKLAKSCGSNHPITFRISRTRIDCAASGRGLTSKLIDAAFPDYRRVLPRSIAASADIDAAALIQALGRLAAIAGGDARVEAAGIAWGDGDTAVTLSLPRAAETAEDILDAATTGAASFAVSTSKLKELVSEITGKTVTLQAATKGEPIVITDVGDPGYYSLVMPMTV
jgi:DNA polymerase-3 subunit beta